MASHVSSNPTLGSAASRRSGPALWVQRRHGPRESLPTLTPSAGRNRGYRRRLSRRGHGVLGCQMRLRRHAPRRTKASRRPLAPPRCQWRSPRIVSEGPSSSALTQTPPELPASARTRDPAPLGGPSEKPDAGHTTDCGVPARRATGRVRRHAQRQVARLIYEVTRA